MFERVLIVENDADTADIISLILKEEFFEVYLVDPIDLQTSIEKIKPRLVILDHFLEYGILGSCICEQMKKTAMTSSPRIILISVNNKLEPLAKACNADAYIQKPFDIVDFCNTVKEILTLE